MVSQFADMMMNIRGKRSQTEVAKGAKISRSSIVRAESGERLLRLSTLRKWCIYLNYDLDNAVALMSLARQERDQRKVREDGTESQSDLLEA